MVRETEAIHPARWLEKLFLLAFVAGGAWCGHRLSKVYQAQSVDFKKESVNSTHVGAQWNEMRVFETIAPIHHWEERQAALTEQVQRRVNRAFDFGHLVALFPPALHDVSEFEDYTVRPSWPLGGAVFNLERGPRCVDFIWTEIPVSGVHYTLEVAKSRNFAFYRSFGASKNSLRIQANKKGDYFWRIRASHDRSVVTSGMSSFLVLEPEMTAEQRRLKDLAARVKDPSAWLADLQFCR